MKQGERVKLNHVYYVREWSAGEMTDGGYTTFLFIPTKKGRDANTFVGNVLGEGQLNSVRRHEMETFDGNNADHAAELWAAVARMHERLVFFDETFRNLTPDEMAELIKKIRK